MCVLLHNPEFSICFTLQRFNYRCPQFEAVRQIQASKLFIIHWYVKTTLAELVSTYYRLSLGNRQHAELWVFKILNLMSQNDIPGRLFQEILPPLGYWYYRLKQWEPPENVLTASVDHRI